MNVEFLTECGFPAIKRNAYCRKYWKGQVSVLCGMKVTSNQRKDTHGYKEVLSPSFPYAVCSGCSLHGAALLPEPMCHLSELL